MKERISKRQLNNIIVAIAVIIAIGLIILVSATHKESFFSKPHNIMAFSNMTDVVDESITVSKASMDAINKNTEHKEKEDSKENSNQNEKSNSFTEVPASETGEFFITSIIDGETVALNEYSFTITQIRDDLEVLKVDVLVNGKIIKEFNGNVFLDDGENTITVRCTYRDNQSKRIIAQKDYVVNVGDKKLIISTSLKDMVTNNPYLEFYAVAVLEKEECKLKVTLNGAPVELQEKSIYSVTLEEGDNLITLKSEKGKFSESKEFLINYMPDGHWGIFTNLTSKRVQEDHITFNAKVSGGTNRARLQVFVNGTQITGVDDKYEAPLEIGNNTIRLKAIDVGKDSVWDNYTIRYVPKATKETAPKLTYINISDGKRVKGDTFKLSIGAEDYKGNRIFYDGIEVRLNGKAIQYRWSNEYVSYQLSLRNGKNSVSVLLRDNDGREALFQYDVICEYIEEGTKIGRVNVILDAKVLHLGTLASGSVDIYYGDTVADAITRFLTNRGFDLEHAGTTKKGFYLSAIKKGGITNGWRIDQKLLDEIEGDGLMLNRDPDTGDFVYSRGSLGQYDFCQGAGWMYTVNGSSTNYGMSEYRLEDGDQIGIRFTLAYGKDINIHSSSGGNQGIKDKYENTY